MKPGATISSFSYGNFQANPGRIDPYHSSPLDTPEPEDESHKTNTSIVSTTPIPITEIAIVGVGDWAQRALIPSLISDQQWAGLQRIHLITDDNLDQVSARFRDDHLFQIHASGDLDLVLSRTQVGAVLISTPDEKHYHFVRAALHTGKHVFVEKSFVREVRKAEELVSLADAQGLTLMVGYVYQYDTRFAALRRMIDAGAIGPVVEVDLHLINRQHGPIGMNEKYGANIVHHHVTHLLSILQSLFGLREIEQLRIDHAGENEARMRLRYGDVNVRLVTVVDQPVQSNYRHLKVRGKMLTVELDFDNVQPNFTVKDSRTHRPIVSGDLEYPREIEDIPAEPAVANELRELLHCIEISETPASGGVAAIHLVKLTTKIDLAYRFVLAEQFKKAAREKAELCNELEAGLDAIGSPGIRVEHQPALVAASRQVLEYLGQRPFAPAEEIMRVHELNRDELRLIYRAIQRSPTAQAELEKGANYDYLNVVRTFFGEDHFEATFFVGLACPYKCSFCRMVEASVDQREGYLGQGEVDLRPVRFDYGSRDLLPHDRLCVALDDLARLCDRGRQVTVKVSGGLEPLSDPRRVEAIIEESAARGLPVKIYTNGILARTPELRALLLRASDVRISLNALNNDYFQHVYLNGAKGGKNLSFEKIHDILLALIAERRDTGSTTQIGINYVVGRDNVGTMEGMAELAHSIGVDFVNYNADYSDDFDDRTYLAIREEINKLRVRRREGTLGGLRLSFGGALLRENLFSALTDGDFDPISIRRHKVFIDPAGLVTPIHEGTFPLRRAEPTPNPYVLGSLRDQSLLEMLDQPMTLGRIEYKYLAPFELILGMESLREAQDMNIGLTPEDSPYRRQPTRRVSVKQR